MQLLVVLFGGWPALKARRLRPKPNYGLIFKAAARQLDSMQDLPNSVLSNTRLISSIPHCLSSIKASTLCATFKASNR